MLQILLLSVFCARCALAVSYYQDSDWWNSLDTGNDWQTSNFLDAISPFAQTFRQIQQQLDMFGYAQHVGKINRGDYLNPELNLPGDRAFGYRPDFKPQDLKFGPFQHKPQGQKFVAKPIHVNLGLASKAGEIRVMPLGQHVQADGTVLVQTKGKQDPCNPSPCTNVHLSRCVVVNDVTAKCMGPEKYELSLTWVDPADDGSSNCNDLDLVIIAATHEGAPCKNSYIDYDEKDCGVSVSSDDEAAFGSKNRGEEIATLTTLADGTTFQDYTYAVIAEYYDHNLSDGSPVLTVTDDDGGDVIQTLAIPQFDGVTNINYDWRSNFFFGCWSSPKRKIITTGAGFYETDDKVKYKVGNQVVNTGLTIRDAGLCKTLGVNPASSGFNPYPQSGTGDERIEQ